jgi:YD repeat-containing protein
MGMNETDDVSQKKHVRLGRLPMKTTRKALLFSDFFKFVKLPSSQTYWKKKTPLPLRSYGNLDFGDCTRAKQAVATTRMERIEQRRLIEITDAEVIRVYTEMSDRLYGGGDNGAFEDDALNEWRNPEKTFRDTNGNPYTIDAYLRINAANHDEMKAALALAGAKGIAICINLPATFADIEPPQAWDVPDGQALVGEWMPGSWGGHSSWCNGYSKDGIVIDHTWELDNQILSWDAVAAYVDEAHLVVDSVDAWRKTIKTQKAVKFDIAGVREAVNAVSSIQI